MTLNKHEVIYEWKYVVVGGDPDNKDDIGDRLELQKYDDGTYAIVPFSYEDEAGRKDVVAWFNQISEDELKRLASVITAACNDSDGSTKASKNALGL